MKYPVVYVVFMSVNGLCAMHGDETSKAEQIRLMQEWIEESKKTLQAEAQSLRTAHAAKEAPASPATAAAHDSAQPKVRLARARHANAQGRSGSPTALLTMIEEYNDQQISNLEKIYKEALEVIKMHSEQRDQRMVTILDKQSDTIGNLNDLIKRLMINGYKLQTRVGAQEQNLEEFKDGTDQNVGRLLDAVTDQSQMFVKQNAVIRELMNRVEKLTQKSADQARKLSVQSMALAKLRKIVEELSEQHTEKQIDDLLVYFSDVLKDLKDLKERPPFPETVNDAELDKFLFGDVEVPSASAQPAKDKEEEIVETIIIEEEVSE